MMFAIVYELKWKIEDIESLLIINRNYGYNSFYFWYNKIEEVLKAKSKSIEV